jgi:hypothetical protein
MGFFLFAIFVSFATFNLIFLLTKLRDRENQRKRFEEIDRFKAEQRALGNPEIEEKTKDDFSQLRKDKIHIWKD